jgi:hypothetical protein
MKITMGRGIKGRCTELRNIRLSALGYHDPLKESIAMEIGNKLTYETFQNEKL